MRRVFLTPAVCLVFALLTGTVQAGPVLQVPMPSVAISESAELGSAEVDGVGRVSFTAKRNGNQLIVLALGPGGEVIGKADSVIGLPETPIYLRAKGGLSQFKIVWGQGSRKP